MTDGPIQNYDSDDRSWDAKPRLAMAVRVALAVTPALASTAVGLVAGRWFPPAELGVNKWVWWLGVLALALAVLAVIDRLTRRLLPMAALLKLSLIFPDQAPSRFAVAMRNGTTRSLQRRIEEIRESGHGLDDESRYAEQMLELVAALSVHDRMTRGHCERVRAYTDLIIEEMGLPEEDAGKLRWAALLHDVGKLMVPYEILNKDAGRPRRSGRSSRATRGWAPGSSSRSRNGSGRGRPPSASTTNAGMARATPTDWRERTSTSPPASLPSPTPSTSSRRPAPTRSRCRQPKPAPRSPDVRAPSSTRRSPGPSCKWVSDDFASPPVRSPGWRACPVCSRSPSHLHSRRSEAVLPRRPRRCSPLLPA